MPEDNRDAGAELQHPKENRGLAAALKRILTGQPDPEGSAAMDELEATRQANREAAARNQEAKLDHLEEVSGEQRVVSPDHRNDRVDTAADESSDQAA